MAASSPNGALETPVFFDTGAESLFGVVTRAAQGPGGTGILIGSGGLTGTSTVGRNRLYVALARALAADGYHSLRFDYHGIGESTGVLHEFRLDADQPFVDDLVGAASCLRGLGVDRLVLLGKCFGSRMALAAAGQLESVVGVVLIGAPVRDFGKGERTVARLATELGAWGFVRRAARVEVLRNLANRRHRAVYTRAATAKLAATVARVRRRSAAPDTDAFWVSPRFLHPLDDLVRRRVPVQLVYGVEDDFYGDFARAREQGRLAELLERAGSRVEVSEVHGLVRGFVTAAGQEAIIDAARDWLARHTPVTFASPRG